MDYKSMRLLPLLGILVFASSQAGANKLPFKCATVEELDATAEDCEDNNAFGDAAIDCFEALEAYIKKESETHKKSLLEQNKQQLDNGKSKQNTNLNAAALGYDSTNKHIQKMLEVANLVLQQVGKYDESVYLPHGWDSPDTADEALAYVKTEPCFTDVKSTIKMVREDVEGVIKDLNDTNKKVSEKEGASTASKVSVGKAPSVPKKGFVKKPTEPAKSAKGLDVKKSTVSDTTRAAPAQPKKTQ